MPKSKACKNKKKPAKRIRLTKTVPSSRSRLSGDDREGHPPYAGGAVEGSRRSSKAASCSTRRANRKRDLPRPNDRRPSRRLQRCFDCDRRRNETGAVGLDARVTKADGRFEESL